MFTPMPYAVKTIQKVAGGQAGKGGAVQCCVILPLASISPGNSVLHRCDPRLKLVATIAYIVVLFVAPNPPGPGAVALPCWRRCTRWRKIPGKLILKSLKPIVSHRAVHGGAQPVFCHRRGRAACPHLGVDNIYGEGIRYAILLAVRVCALIAGTSLLTYTTSPIVLTDAIENAAERPLAKIHFPVHELAMMMTIALRFIPTLIEETDKIMNAQKARGAMLDNGNFHRSASRHWCRC